MPEGLAPTAVICRAESVGYQHCGTHQNQETRESIDQWEMYTYYWSVRPHGQLERVTSAVVDRLVPEIRYHETEKVPYSGCYFFSLSVCNHTGVSEFSVKEAFYAHLYMIVNSGVKANCLIVRGDSNATNATDRDGYESCVGLHGSRSLDESSLTFLNLTKCRRLRISVS